MPRTRRVTLLGTLVLFLSALMGTLGCGTLDRVADTDSSRGGDPLMSPEGLASRKASASPSVAVVPSPAPPPVLPLMPSQQQPTAIGRMSVPRAIEAVSFQPQAVSGASNVAVGSPNREPASEHPQGSPPALMRDAANGWLPGGGPIPRELCKLSLPPYRVEPPDILLLDAVRMIPKPPYRAQPLDVLLVQLAAPLPNQPVAGLYPVTPDGRINLGFSYGSVRVAGLTLEEIEAALRNHLKRLLTNPQVSVSLAQFRGVQQVRGEHLVSPDGTISLGVYGYVYVAGLTKPEAKSVIEQHLSQFVMDPEISLDVFAYNSKVYYVITDGAGYGQQLFRFPITGNETVLDAISNIYGLPAVASKRKIWVARPAPPGHPCDQVLPVDWNAITQGGSTNTNYQLFPGDRVYVKADSLIAIDNALAKLLAPVERVLGATLLGNLTVQSFRGNAFSNTLP